MVPLYIKRMPSDIRKLYVAKGYIYARFCRVCDVSAIRPSSLDLSLAIPFFFPGYIASSFLSSSNIESFFRNLLSILHKILPI